MCLYTVPNNNTWQQCKAVLFHPSLPFLQSISRQPGCVAGFHGKGGGSRHWSSRALGSRLPRCPPGTGTKCPPHGALVSSSVETVGIAIQELWLESVQQERTSSRRPQHRCPVRSHCLRMKELPCLLSSLSPSTE